MRPRPVRTRSRRVLRWVARLAAAGAGLLVVCFAAVLATLDSAPSRELTRRKVNEALSGAFRGRVTIEAIGGLGLTGARGVDLRVTAPDGTQVLTARGAAARIVPLDLLASILGRGDLRVAVLEASVEEADVALDPDPTGALEIQAAFEPRSSPSPGGPPGRSVHVTLANIAVVHARVHGRPKGAPAMDADLDRVRGSLRAGPEGVDTTVTHAEVATRGLPAGADVVGTVTGRVAVPAPGRAGILVDGAFHGEVGGIPTATTAAIDPDRVDAVIDVPETPAEKVRALWHDAPLAQPASAHVEAHGSLTALHLTGRATVGATRLEVAGDASIADDTSATLHAEVKDADLRAFVPQGPTSRADLSADAKMTATTMGAVDGTFDLALRKATVEGRALPSATFHGDFAKKEGASGVGLTVRGNVAQPGAPTSLVATFEGDGKVPAIRFQATSRIDDLRAIGAASGRASAHADGVLSLSGAPSIDATLEADLTDACDGPASVDEAKLVAHAIGPLANPVIDATIDARSVTVDLGDHSAQGRRFFLGQVHATTRGTPARQRVTVSMHGDPYDVRADATLRLGAGVGVDAATFDLSRAATSMHVEAERVDVEPGRLDVEGARITGVGAPAEVTLHARPRSLVLKADSPELDLKALGYLFGLESSVRGGRLAVRGEVSARPDRAEGTMAVDLTDGAFLGWDGVGAHLDARLDGRTLAGSMQVVAAGIGSLTASEMRVEFGGDGPLDAPSWRKAWGRVRFEGQADLGKLSALLPPNALPFASVSGDVALRGHLVRHGELDAKPDVALSLQTSGLQVAWSGGAETRKDGVTVVTAPAFRSSGVDLHVDASANGDSGFTEVDARLTDGAGSLVAVDAKSDAVPYAAMFASWNGMADRLAQVPVSAIVTLPSRKLESLPAVLRIPGVRGDCQATATLEGSYLAPAVRLQGAVREVRFDSLRNAAPLDADLGATYDGKSGDATLAVGSRGKTILLAGAHANAPVDGLFGPAATWDASAEAAITDLPLESIPTLADRRFHGMLRGRVEMTGLHRDARALADVTVERLRIGRTAYGSATASATFDGQMLDSNVLLQQSDGAARADARFGMKWGPALGPTFDATRMARASFEATRLRLAFLAPFVPNTFDELDGRVDARASASIVPDRPPVVSGSAVLSDGVVSLTALGQEFRSVTGKVTLQSDGTVRVDDVSASATTGRLTASGVARLQGPHLVQADATLKIAKGDAMPLEVQGTPVGTAYGQITLRATTSADRRTMNVSLDAPSWHVTLPDASTHAVQDLQPPPARVHVGVYASSDRFVQLHGDEGGGDQAASAPESANTITLNVRLGQDVEVKRGTDLRVDLDGDLVAQAGGPKPTVTGQIRLRGGVLTVQGKSFDIQPGSVVTFGGDPSNPDVRVTAMWVAPDGTRVFADYAGPLKTGKVTLRSNPALAGGQPAIFALIVSGTVDESSSTAYGTQSSDAATTAGTAVGGFATGGLTQGIDKLTGLDVTAKIDTSQANPRPELQVQIARSISLELAYVIGTPPPGSNPDTTYATIGWRFLRHWSLDTTFGNLGSTIADVVWQRRY